MHINKWVKIKLIQNLNSIYNNTKIWNTKWFADKQIRICIRPILMQKYLIIQRGQIDLIEFTLTFFFLYISQLTKNIFFLIRNKSTEYVILVRQFSFIQWVSIFHISRKIFSLGTQNDVGWSFLYAACYLKPNPHFETQFFKVKIILF